MNTNKLEKIGGLAKSIIRNADNCYIVANLARAILGHVSTEKPTNTTTLADLLDRLDARRMLPRILVLNGTDSTLLITSESFNMDKPEAVKKWLDRLRSLEAETIQYTVEELTVRLSGPVGRTDEVKTGSPTSKTCSFRKLPDNSPVFDLRDMYRELRALQVALEIMRAPDTCARYGGLERFKGEVLPGNKTYSMTWRRAIWTLDERVVWLMHRIAEAEAEAEKVVK